MRIFLGKLYNGIMYGSFFLAIMGVYCKITYKYTNDESVIFYFVTGVIMAIIILLVLRHLFRVLYLWCLK